MIRFLAAPLALALTATPATAATRTAGAARAPGTRLSSTAQPIRAALRPTTSRKPRYELNRIMSRNFGSAGRHQLDLLVASVQ